MDPQLGRDSLTTCAATYGLNEVSPRVGVYLFQPARLGADLVIPSAAKAATKLIARNVELTARSRQRIFDWLDLNAPRPSGPRCLRQLACLSYT